MRSAPIRRPLAALTALAALTGGCGTADSEKRVHGSALTVYASAPMHGAARGAGRDVVDGERLALAGSGARVSGSYSVRLKVLDDAPPPTVGRWSPDAVAENARLAVKDPTTVAYLGEQDTAGSTVSLPILSRQGILQVSPTDTFAGPTRPEGGVPGEPAKYYPTMRRTFGRLVPDDDRQAVSLANWVAEEGVGRLLVIHDMSLYGSSLGAEIARGAVRRGLRLASALAVEPASVIADSAKFVAAARAAQADGIVFAGTGAGTAARLFRLLHGALPEARLYATAAQSLPAFAGRLGKAAGATRLIALPPLDPTVSARFARDFRGAYGRVPRPEAAYGYEAMSVVLAAVHRAGSRAGLRREVLAQFLPSRRSGGPLGSYSLRRGGASSLRSFARYRVGGGRLELAR